MGFRYWYRDFTGRRGDWPGQEPVLALEIVQVLVAGTTVPKTDSTAPAVALVLRLAPNALLRRDALYYQKSFESVDPNYVFLGPTSLLITPLIIILSPIPETSNPIHRM